MTTKKQLIARLKFALKYGWKIPDEILDHVDFEHFVDETLGFYENLYSIIEEIPEIRKYVERRRKEQLVRELSEYDINEIIALIKVIDYIEETGDERYKWILEELEKQGLTKYDLLSVLYPRELKTLSVTSIGVTEDVITVYIYDQAIIIPSEELADYMKGAIERALKRLPAPKRVLEFTSKDEIKVKKPKWFYKTLFDFIQGEAKEVKEEKKEVLGMAMKRHIIKLPCDVRQIDMKYVKDLLESYEMKLVRAYDKTIEILYPEKLAGLVIDIEEEIKRLCPKVRRKIERERKRIKYYEEVYKEAMRESRLSEKEIEEIVERALRGII